LFPVAAPSVPLTSAGSHSHRPSGPEALDLAKNTDRPILLSIGYSACQTLERRGAFGSGPTSFVQSTLHLLPVGAIFVAGN
jgi:hypothetical protein